MRASNKLAEERQRITDIQLVTQEKDAMVTVAKELFALVKDYPEQIDEAAFRNKALEFIKHITNLAGFCDKEAQYKISLVIRELTAMIIDPNALVNFTSTKVRAIIPLAIGIQVDFTNRPFRVIGFTVEGLGAKVKGILKR